MFIETLEFTIPIDLCSLFSTLQKGPRANLEFPASVNSYGTTQDACLQVNVRANKLTFKVDGVSSDSSIISKSECKTLKLAVFDVDRSLIPQDTEQVQYESSLESFTPSMQALSKRTHEDSYSSPVPAKSSRTSYSESPSSRSPVHNVSQIKPRSSNNNAKHKSSNDTPVNVKQEPEDPDLIEIEPDPEPDDIVPKKETPYMQIDYSSNEPHTQTSQAAFDRVSFPPTSRSQSSSSSFHQNVPHVQDYGQPGPSHGDQSAEDFLVFQDDNDYGDDNDNSADYSNDGSTATGQFSGSSFHGPEGLLCQNPDDQTTYQFAERRSWAVPVVDLEKVSCPVCHKTFSSSYAMKCHQKTIHDNFTFDCLCGKSYKSRGGMWLHRKICMIYKAENDG